MSTRSLLERRAAVVAEMRGITQSPAGSAGDLSADQSHKFDTLKGELEGLEKRIARQQLLDDAERRMQGQPIAGTGDNRLDSAMREFSLRKAICAQVPDLRDKVDCGREIELSAELARRSSVATQGMCAPMAAMTLERRTLIGGGGSPDSGGINLIPTDQRPELFIDALRSRTVVRRLGARVLAGLSGNIDIPKQATAAATAWVAEDTALSANDPTFQKIHLDPLHCGALTEYSRNMLLQSSPDIEQLIRADFAKSLANALDIAAINGAGTTEPLGVLNLPGLATVSGSLSWSKVLQMEQTLEEHNVEPTGFVTTPKMKRYLRTTPKVTSTDSVMIQQERGNLAGYPIEVTTNAPSTLGSPAEAHALILGDWSDLLIGMWSELDILVNPYESSAYARGNVKVRAMMSVDIAARHVESFVAAVDVTPF